MRRAYHSVGNLLPDGRVLTGGGKHLPNWISNPPGLPGDEDAEGDPADSPNCQATLHPDFDDWDVSSHTLDIFSPPYMFRPRPQILLATLDDPSTDTYDYADSVTFEVDLVSSSDSVHRVALIRNGSSTHAFDADQRYVEVAITLITTPSGAPANRRQVTIAMPDHEYWAPPGYYMLVVKDQSHRPSMAAWIRLKREVGG